jgi:predicted nucleic acid-binding protein
MIALDTNILVYAHREDSAWFRLPESPGCLEKLSGLLKTGLVTGPQVHDARIAALCLHHGIRELWTADRDFSRFSNLKTSNPML